MEHLRELLAVDQRQVLEFFVVGLRDVCEPGVDHQELCYNASVLAHYAQTSTCAADEMPTPSSLSDVFDHFVLDTTMMYDGAMMETAGAQCLLLAGFFERQMRDRHNIRWYAEVGAGCFSRAAAQATSSHRAKVLDALATRFEAWRQRHERLGRELRDRPYLLAPPPATPM
jgi:hypothetical protein